jgi:hypothetical protein
VDSNTGKVLGGGFYDKNLVSKKDLENFAPGIMIGIAGLSSYMAQNAKPIISYEEITQSHAAQLNLSIIPLLTRAIQESSGITNIISGTPTNSQADKTFRGMELLAEESDDRLNSSLVLYEDNILKKYAEYTYDNYVRFLNPQIDLPQMLDKESLYYTDKNGQRLPVHFGENLRYVTFIFENAKRVVNREIRLGKKQRLLQSISMIGQMKPILDNIGMDTDYLLKDITKDLDIADIDLLFPPEMTPAMRLQQAMQQLQVLQMTHQLMNQAIQATLQQLQQTNDQYAINALQTNMNKAQQIFQQMQQKMQQQVA